MKVLRWLDKHFEECIMFANLWIIVCLSTIQIIMRYLFKNSLSWPEEMNRLITGRICFRGHHSRS